MRALFPLVAVVAAASLAMGQEGARPPNVLLVMADDLGPEWLSCYGGKELETPHLDTLAQEGMRFLNAWSMPKCTPTRVTLLTGQYPFRHGWVNHWDVPRWGAGCHFDPSHNVTFARVLREAGYATAVAGKWQINDFRVQPDVLRAHGFDDWCVWTGYETGNAPSAERYWDPYVHTQEGSATRAGEFGSDVFVDFLIEFMKEHRQQPMLLYYPMVLPHTPFTTTPLEPEVEGREGRQRAMVQYVDHAVGRLLDAIDALELREQTVVIFTGDNGSTRGLRARTEGGVVTGGKGLLGENGVRTPLLVRWPGHVPAVVSAALADSTDLFPTLCGLAGAVVGDDHVLDGSSLVSVLTGRSERGERQWLLAMGGGVARIDAEGRVVPAREHADRVVRDARFKLWVEDGRPTRLFDLIADPHEGDNLIDARDPEAVAARQRLAAVIDELPRSDGVPRYDPTPPQVWDRKRRAR